MNDQFVAIGMAVLFVVLLGLILTGVVCLLYTSPTPRN